jgi:tRNA modification GTPase
LKRALVERARSAMLRPGEAALSRRQRELIGAALDALDGAEPNGDPLLLAEHLRGARLAFDRLIGRAATEDMLDALFGRFCIGK